MCADLVGVVHLVFDHAFDITLVADNAGAAVFDPVSEDEVVGVAFDRAHHPVYLRVAERVELEVNAVRAGVHHAGFDCRPQALRFADGSVGDHAAGFAPAGIEAALVADGEFYFVALSGNDHRVGFAERYGHRFFAEHGFGAARAGGDRHFSVLGIPRADADDVEVFFVEHFAVIGIGRLDVEVGGIAGERFGVRVGDGGDFGVLAFGPAAAVLAGDAARGDDADAVFGCHGGESFLSRLNVWHSASLRLWVCLLAGE